MAWRNTSVRRGTGTVPVPIHDVRVLCPMNRGGMGARSLNLELQRWLTVLDGVNRICSHGVKEDTPLGYLAGTNSSSISSPGSAAIKRSPGTAGTSAGRLSSLPGTEHHLGHPPDQQHGVGLLAHLSVESVVGILDHPVGQRACLGKSAEDSWLTRMRHDVVVLGFDDQHVAAKAAQAAKRGFPRAAPGAAGIRLVPRDRAALGNIPVLVPVERRRAQASQRTGRSALTSAAR